MNYLLSSKTEKKGLLMMWNYMDIIVALMSFGSRKMTKDVSFLFHRLNILEHLVTMRLSNKLC